MWFYFSNIEVCFACIVEKKTRNPKCSYLFYLEFILMFCSISSINNGFKCATVWMFNKNLLAILSSSLLMFVWSANGCTNGFSLYAHKNTYNYNYKKNGDSFICSNLSSLFFSLVLFLLFSRSPVAIAVHSLSFRLFVVCRCIWCFKTTKKKLFVRFIYPKHFQFIAMHSKWNLVTHALFFFYYYSYLLGVCVLQAKVPLKNSTKPCF